MSEAQTFQGSCHCGAVTYDVTMVPPEKAFACNCSICGRTGALLAFVPKETFVLKTGEAAMTDYQFGKKHIHHKFCTTCGIRAFAHGAGKDGVEMVAINLRCLAGFDAAKLPVNNFDGAAL
jgi:hypothetical protein